MNSYCRFEKDVKFGHLEKMFISKLSLTGFHALLSLLMYKFLAFTVKQGSPAGLYFSLPFIPCRDFSPLTTSLYLFPIHNQSHIPSRTGVYLTLSLWWRVLIVSGPHTVGGWICLSKSHCFFYTVAPTEKRTSWSGQVIRQGLVQGLCSSSSLWLFRTSCSGVLLLVRAPGWYNCTLCFYKYQLGLDQAYPFE